MKNGLTKLHYLSLGLLMVGVAGCGANKVGNTDATSPSGAISAKLAWSSSKSAAKALAAVPAGIDHLKFTVTGSGANGALPVVTSNAAASTTQGNIGGVYPGTVAVAVKALDAAGNSLYEGYAINVTVNPNATTNVGTINMTPPTVKAEEAPCLTCHETTLDATGQNIVANYKQSSHYFNTSFTDANGVEPGCAGCHGKSHNTPDPSALGSTQIVGNTAAATSVGSTRCFDCHNINSSNTVLVSTHDTYYLANSTGCEACHQNHNSMAGNMERTTWDQSRHGATDFAHMVGGTSLGCATRCHNAKGFAAAVSNPNSPVQGTILPAPQMITCDACHTNAPLGILRSLPGTKATAFATYTTSTKGYQFAPYNNLNPNKKKYYPDVAGSNLCIICHSGTTEGTSAPIASKGSDPYFAIYTANRSTVKPHNMPSAAVMYVKFGFTNLSTGTAGAPTQAYLNGLTSDLDGGTVTSTHRKFGTSAIVSDSHFSASHPAPANFLTNGPCAVCHVSGSHTYKIDQAAYNAVCVNCHTSENGNDLTTGIDSFLNNFVDPQQEVYNNAIALGAMFVNQKIAAYNAANPATPINAWVRQNGEYRLDTPSVLCPQKKKLVISKYDAVQGVDGTWASSSVTLPQLATALGYSVTGSDLGRVKFVGALSNLTFFSQDQGGFAHARTYSRRLMYDSLNFLANGNLSSNTTLAAKAVALSGIATFNANGSGLSVANTVAGLYTKGAKAYNPTLTTTGVNASGTPTYGITTPYTGTSESMLFLIGWNRSGTTNDTNTSTGSGAWTAVERP